jgi:hypothetical protein
MPAKLKGKSWLFNPLGIAAAYVSMLGSDFSLMEKQAAAHTIVQHNQHATTYSKTRTDGGLHPMYLELHGLGSASEQEHKDNKMLLEASQSDVFNTVSFFLP